MVEEAEPMAMDDYAPDSLATLAQETARKVGWHAVRWWRDPLNPRRLYIEVNYRLSNGQPFPVWISTLIPGHVECSR